MKNLKSVKNNPKLKRKRRRKKVTIQTEFRGKLALAEESVIVIVGFF